jgi:hypothetical protein
VKRSVLVEANGGPLAMAIAGASVHDTKLLAATLAAIVVARPEPSPEQPQHLCLDKAYDNPSGEEAVAVQGYVPNIRRTGGSWNGRWPGSRSAGRCWCATTSTPSTSWAAPVRVCAPLVPSSASFVPCETGTNAPFLNSGIEYGCARGQGGIQGGILCPDI